MCLILRVANTFVNTLVIEYPILIVFSDRVYVNLFRNATLPDKFLIISPPQTD